MLTSMKCVTLLFLAMTPMEAFMPRAIRPVAYTVVNSVCSPDNKPAPAVCAPDNKPSPSVCAPTNKPAACAPTSKPASSDSAVSVEKLFQDLSPLGRARFIVMQPDRGCILEAVVDLAAPTTSISSKDMPSGAILVTVKSADRDFECHVDVTKARSASLTLSDKTGGPVVRLSGDATAQPFCTILFDKDQIAAFEAVRSSLGETVELAAPAPVATAPAPVASPEISATDAVEKCNRETSAATDAPNSRLEAKLDGNIFLRNFKDSKSSKKKKKCRLMTAEELEIEFTTWDTPMILDCFATWCGPCQMMIPEMDRVATLFGDRCRVLKFDTDEYPEIADQFQVAGLPTLLFIKAGENGEPALCHRLEGAVPADQLVNIAEHLFYDKELLNISPEFGAE